SVVDSPEVAEACARAMESIGRLPSGSFVGDDEPESNLRETTVKRLIAFRDVSQLGHFSVHADSPCVAEVFEMLLRPNTLQQLEPLCGEWIGWARRKTDGMLLIGTLRQEAGDQFVVLADGTRLRVQLAEHVELPIDSKCVALGKIISTDEAPLVQLVAGVVVP
ncbi:MAG: hypothetical protein KDB00_29830, partial [Planctomycetales bacterium]|nr:hypothetical protein [Planctomycetales bacterium]